MKTCGQKMGDEAFPCGRDHLLGRREGGNSTSWHLIRAPLWRGMRNYWMGKGCRGLCFGQRERLQYDFYVVVQLLSHIPLLATPWTAACQASLFFSISLSLLKLHWVGDAIQPSHSLSSPSLPALNPSHRESFPMSHIRWPKYWSFSISPFSEYSELIFFRIDWFDLLAVHRTLRSLFQHHNLKASVLQRSAFFMVQITYPRTWLLEKTISFTVWTSVGKVMSLLFNTLSRFIIAFLPGSKRLLISWLQSLSAVVLEPEKIKSVHSFPVYLPWSEGTKCHILSFLNVEF